MRAAHFGVLCPVWLLVAAVSLGLSAASAFAQRGEITITQITDTVDCGNEYPTLEASGNQFAFESNCDLIPGGNLDHSSEAFLLDIDGSNPIQLTDGLSGGLGNVWVNASGKKIVFATTRDLVPGQNLDGNSEIFVMNVDGTNLRQLTHTTGANEHGTAHGLPAIDYAGKRVFFVSFLDPNGVPTDQRSIWVVNVDGTGLQLLTPGFDASSPSLDAHGNVYFVGGGSTLYRMRPDGTQVVQLAPDEVTAHSNEKTGVDASGSRLVFTSLADLVPERIRTAAVKCSCSISRAARSGKSPARLARVSAAEHRRSRSLAGRSCSVATAISQDRTEIGTANCSSRICRNGIATRFVLFCQPFDDEWRRRLGFTNSKRRVVDVHRGALREEITPNGPTLDRRTA